MLVIMFLQPVWSHFPFGSHLLWMCARLCVWVCEQPPFSGVYSVHWTQWLQCSYVCASACVCMTAALNPVTGHGMSSTEIAAEPLAPLPTDAVCVTSSGEANKLTHTSRRGRAHKLCLCPPRRRWWRRKTSCLDSASLFLPDGASSTCIWGRKSLVFPL